MEYYSHTKNKNNDGGTVTVHCTVYIEKRRTSGPMTPRTKQLDGLSLFHPYTFSASNKYVLEICKTIQTRPSALGMSDPGRTIDL